MRGCFVASSVFRYFHTDGKVCSLVMRNEISRRWVGGANYSATVREDLARPFWALLFGLWPGSGVRHRLRCHDGLSADSFAKSYCRTASRRST